MVLKFWMYRAFIVSTIITLIFAVIVITTSTVGAKYSYLQANVYVPLVDITYNVNEAALKAGYHFRAFTYTFDKNDFDRGINKLADLDRSLSELRTHVQAYPDDIGDQLRKVDDLIVIATQYRRLATELNSNVLRALPKGVNLKRLSEQVHTDHHEYWSGDTLAAVINRELAALDYGRLRRRIDRLISTNSAYNALGRTNAATFAISRAATTQQREDIVALAKENMDIINSSMVEINRTTQIPYFLNLSRKILDTIAQYNTEMSDMMGIFRNVGGIGIQKTELFERLSSETEDLSEKAIGRLRTISKEAYSRQGNTTLMAIITILTALVFGYFYTQLFTKKITVNLRKVTDDLDEAANNLADVSNNASASVSHMSDATARNATNLEEISSSLTEITSMTSQTATNAKSAEGLVKDSVEKAKVGQDAMNRLNEAVIEIQNSSNDTAKILKDIDEIAFQTNLLALNAAVEAARAGEAGKGFAVVAEEVRSLAQRSAESAKKTADLIQGSQQSSAQGVSLAQETAAAIEKITITASKISVVVGEITNAAKEQAQGVSSIAKAVNDMNVDTQSSATDARNISDNTQVLAQEAMALRNMVISLLNVTEGKAPGTKVGGVSVRSKPSVSVPQQTQLIAFDDD
ncbi:MAG: methyl-accepting chemotaxis protein [Chitinivibrionia bacterium]|nr:methyl-accepting chemotaxis protein [Chitinivibrionia bacterium]